MQSHPTLSKKIIAAALLMTTATAVYLKVGLFPGRLKKVALMQMERLTQKKISFEKALFIPFHGLSLYNIKISGRDNSPLFVAKRLSIDLRVLPFFREKKIIVKNLILEGAVFDYFTEPDGHAPVRDQPIKTKISGQINVPLVPKQTHIDLRALENGPEFFLPENVYLQQIQIVKGIVNISKDADSPLLEQVREVDIKMAFQKPPLLIFDGSVRLGQDDYGLIRLNGVWNLDTARYEFFLKTNLDRIPGWMLDYQKKNSLILLDGALRFQTHLKSITEERILFHSDVSLDKAEFAFGKAQLSGQMALNAAGVFNFADKVLERYKGTLQLNQITADHVSDKIRRLEKLSGAVEFAPDLITLPDLRGFYRGVAFAASGTIRSFKDPMVDGRIQTRLTFDKLISFLPDEQKKFLGDYVIDGSCKAVQLVKGPLRRINEIKSETKLSIENASVTARRDNKLLVRHLGCELLLGPLGLSVRNARFLFAQQNVRLDLFIPSGPTTPGTMALQYGVWRIDADYQIQPGAVLVNKGRLVSKGLAASGHGKILLKPKPFLDLQGNGRIRLNELPDLFNKNSDQFRALGLVGHLDGPFVLKGVLDQPKLWELKMDGRSDRIVIKKNFRLDNFEIQIRSLGERLNIPYVHATPYGGVIGGKMSLSMDDSDLSFESHFYGHNLDLAAIARDLSPHKQTTVSGSTAFQIDARGFLKSPESLRGSGNLSLTNGLLWQTNLFHQMGELPFVKVEGLNTVSFHELRGNFEIRDKKIWTEDLAILGDTVSLQLKGSLGFDEDLKFLMSIRYSGDVIRGAEDAGGLAPFMVLEAEKNIPYYRISGTLSKPKFEVTGRRPSPDDVPRETLAKKLSI